jgi:hypothetical protein
MAPLIIEVALLPEAGEEPCPDAPMGREGYLEEIHTCYELGASMVWLQALASDSSPDDYRFDYSLQNYRALLKDVIRTAPDIVIDLDIEEAGEDVERWVRCNKRIELDSGREEDNPVTVAVGTSPLSTMRQVIAGGGHLRLGLHDSRAWPYKGKPTNLDYLRQAISMARSLGRPLATPAHARTVLGLPPLKAVYAVPSSLRVKGGDRFFLDAIAGPIDRPFRGYAMMVTPSGVKFSITKKGKPVQGIRPFMGSGEGMRRPYVGTLLDMVVGKRTPPGTYAVYLGLFPPRTQPRPRDAIAIDTALITVE